MIREVAFNLALSRIAAIGYHRAVMFTNLVGAPLIHGALSSGDRGRERSVPRPKTIGQVLRTNRHERTPARLAKQERERTYYLKRKWAKQQQLGLES